MRKIKFRAWDDELKEMLYSKIEQFDDSWMFRFEKHFETDTPIYMQYIGLKDKNGKEIYEGDIVTGLFDRTDIIGHIIYGSDATFFIYRKGLYGIGLNNAEDWLEVIGNIYENPELMEVK